MIDTALSENELEHDPWAALSPAKQAAALALLAGRTPAEAGRQAGASRRTVYRWMQEPAFRAALAEAQAELREAVSARLMAVADDAALCIERRIKEGDGRLALQLLRSLGLLDGWRVTGAGCREEPDERNAPASSGCRSMSSAARRRSDDNQEPGCGGATSERRMAQQSRREDVSKRAKACQPQRTADQRDAGSGPQTRTAFANEDGTEKTRANVPNRAKVCHREQDLQRRPRGAALRAPADPGTGMCPP